MITIKDGSNQKPCKISVVGRNEKDPIAEVWMLMNIKGRALDAEGNVEVLHYATLEEIKKIRDACNEALKEMVGL